MKPFTSFFLISKSNVLVKRVLFLLNAALAVAILHLISQVHLPLFVKMLPKYLKYFAFSSCFWCVIIFTGNYVLKFSLLLFFRLYYARKMVSVLLVHNMQTVRHDGCHTLGTTGFRCLHNQTCSCISVNLRYRTWRCLSPLNKICLWHAFPDY